MLHFRHITVYNLFLFVVFGSKKIQKYQPNDSLQHQAETYKKYCKKKRDKVNPDGTNYFEANNLKTLLLIHIRSDYYYSSEKGQKYMCNRFLI